MASQIIVFEKNKADFEQDYVTVTASQGNDLARNILNRSNRSGWATSESVDSDNTTLEINMSDVRPVDSILLLKHNFKSFQVEYYDDDTSTYKDFSSAIDVTDNGEDSNYYAVDLVNTSKIRITIRGTIVADSDKYLFQFIATKRIGQLNAWPVIKKPTLARDITKKQMLSGKYNVLENVGFYSVRLSVELWRDSDDLAIVEAMYNSSEGFLFWPCGGDTAQFSSVRQGYRMEDIFLVRCMNEYAPEWYKGLYQTGLKLDIDLAEVVT